MTYGTLLGDDEEDISIHTALAGCDDNISFTSPGGHISIHTALAGCDVMQPPIDMQDSISIHTALAGCDLGNTQASQTTSKFQSTQPSQAVTHWP